MARLTSPTRSSRCWVCSFGMPIFFHIENAVAVGCRTDATVVFRCAEILGPSDASRPVASLMAGRLSGNCHHWQVRVLESYGVTTTVTFSVAVRAPSCATHRRTYSPGVLKVARVSHLLSAGIGGVLQPAAHGEFAPSRVSSQALNCGGSKVTSPAPRYFSQTSRSPVAELGTVRLAPKLPASAAHGACRRRWPRRSARPARRPSRDACARLRS